MAAKGGHIDFTFLGFKKIGLGWARSKFTLCTRHWQCLSSANLDQLHGQNCPLHGSIFIHSHRSTILGKKLALSGKSWGHDPFLVQFPSFSCSFSREICQIYRLAPPPPVLEILYSPLQLITVAYPGFPIVRKETWLLNGSVRGRVSRSSSGHSQ